MADRSFQNALPVCSYLHYIKKAPNWEYEFLKKVENVQLQTGNQR